MREQSAYLEQFISNIEDAMGKFKIKQIRFDFSINDRGKPEVDLVVEDNNGVIIAEEIALETFSDALKYLEEHINDPIPPDAFDDPF